MTNNASYETVVPTEAKELIEQGWTYVDVRTVQEFEAGHAEGAFNVPFAVMDPDAGGMRPNPDFVDVMSKNFPVETKLVMACAVGGRSMHACAALAASGFTNLVNMHGGFSGARDMSGAVVQQGWAELGYSNTTDSDADKVYEALKAK